MKNIFLICGLVLLWVNCFGAGLTTSSLNGVATNLTRYGTSANLAVPQPSSGSTNVIGIDSTGKELSIPIGNFSGSGAIPSTTNLLTGNGSGGASDSGIPKQSVLTNNIPTANIGTVHGELIFPDVDGSLIIGSADGIHTLTWLEGMDTWVFTDDVKSSSFSGVGTLLTALNASQLTSGTVGTARLGTGTANSGTYLRGDGSWQPVSGGSGGGITTLVATNVNVPSVGGISNSIGFIPTNYDAYGASQASTNSGNIAFIDKGNTFTPSQTFVGGLFINSTHQSALAGNGSGFFANNALSWDSSGNMTGTSFTGIGSGLTALNGSAVSSGTIGIAFLPSTVLTNLVPTNALVPSVSGHTGFVPTNSTASANAALTGFYRSYPAGAMASASGKQMVMVDLNGDGINDVLQVAGTALNAYTISNGVFVLLSTAAILGSASELVIADVNGDGRPDAIIATGGSVQVWTNNGAGTFAQLGSAYMNGGTAINAVVTADYNGDGKPDFAMPSGASVTPPVFTTFTNNGIGIFSVASTNTLAASQNFLNMATGDFNNDGRPDLVGLANTSPFPILFYTNSGSATFSLYQSNATPAISFTVQNLIATGDVNGDGRIDVAFADTATAKVFTMTNGLTSMNFYATNQMGSGTFNSIAMGDMLRNGSSALIVSAVNPVSVYTLYCNPNGSGMFGYSTNLVGISGAFMGTGDATGDGAPDILVESGSAMVVLAQQPVYGGIFAGDLGGGTNLLTLVNNSTANSFTSGSFKSGLSTPAILSINTNYLPYSTTPSLNLSSSTNLSSTNINFGLFPIQTNLISGQLYTNGYNRPVQVQANVGITTAAVTGDAGMALWIISGVGRGTTNYESISTTVAVSLAMSYTNQLGGFIPTNAIYTFTNISSGAGNSATLIGGQIY